MGDNLDFGYTHIFGGSPTYFGMNNGMFCVGPLANLGIFNLPLTSADYECLRDDIKDWNSKWYSPVCRGWFKKAAAQFNKTSPRGVMTNLYPNASPLTD